MAAPVGSVRRRVLFWAMERGTAPVLYRRASMTAVAAPSLQGRPPLVRAFSVVAAALALAVLATRIARYGAFTLDDTFITLRYSQNLAEGHGLLWNPGAAPVEGYTSPL